MRDALASEHERQSALLQSLLEQQDARLADLLAYQAERHAAEMARLMESHAETLRSLLCETPSPAVATATTIPPPDSSEHDALAELQETLRLGFGELRAGLTHNQQTLARTLRDELHPLVQAALALNRQTPSSTKSSRSPDASLEAQSEPRLSSPTRAPIVSSTTHARPINAADTAPASQEAKIPPTEPIRFGATSPPPIHRPSIPDEHPLEAAS